MIISKAPLRISLVGGMTDFPEFYEKRGYGKVISGAINKYVYCMAKQRVSKGIRISYSKTENVNHAHEIKHDLARTAIQLMRDMRNKTLNLEVVTVSDLHSRGSGLASSSAVMCVLLSSLSKLLRELEIRDEELAKLSNHCELEVLSKTMGVQDAFPCSMGGLRTYTFCSGDEIHISSELVSEHELEEFSKHFMLFGTGLTSKSENVLKSVSTDIGKNFNKIKKILTYVDWMEEHIKNRDYVSIGECLTSYWKIKRRIGNKTTNKKIDTMFNRAINAGAYGGKLVGSGGGGFLLLCVPLHKKDKIRKELSEYEEMPFEFVSKGCEVILNE